jgi:crossover junction endodeoxyribonuclease RusA
MITFTAYGTPAPKGSTKAFFRPGMRFPVVTEDNTHTRPWAAIVKDAAMQILYQHSQFDRVFYPDGPLSLKIVFYMPRPKSLPKRVLFHTKKPDLDKLVRAIKDALTGVVWTDDAQVMSMSAAKLYASEGDMPRAEIQVDQSQVAAASEARIITQKEIEGLGLRSHRMGA